MMEIKPSMKLIGLMALVVFITNSCAYDPSKASIRVKDLQKVLLDEKASSNDMDFPTHPPSIPAGKEVYRKNCAQCHGSTPSRNLPLSLMRSRTPQEQYLVLTRGNNKGMPSFRDKLTREERWDALIYTRTAVLGYFQDSGAKKAELDATFGGNCAVCHGSRGHGDGPLHKSLDPQPANFNQFTRLYTRSDDKLFNEISHGIPWTAMPAWSGRYDFDKHQFFNDALRRDLVRYVRQFTITQTRDRLDKGRMKLEKHRKEVEKAKGRG